MTQRPDQRPVARVTHEFAASADDVFSAWTDPQTVRQWMGQTVAASVDGKMERVEIDPRQGGRFLFSDVRDGKEAVHTGTYLEFERPTRLKFTWETEPGITTVVTIDIEPKPSGCRLVLTHEMDPTWAGAVEQTTAGWQMMVKNMASVVTP